MAFIRACALPTAYSEGQIYLNERKIDVYTPALSELKQYSREGRCRSFRENYCWRGPPLAMALRASGLPPEEVCSFKQGF